MLDRVNVSISLAIIFSILARLALLYGQGDSHSIYIPIDSDSEVYLIFITLFLIFFKGKVMHDDSQFFEDLDNGHFNHPKWTKFGVFIGYWSWFLWAPIIFMLDQPVMVANYLAGSLLLSSLWLVIDMKCRKVPHVYDSNGDLVQSWAELDDKRLAGNPLYKNEGLYEKWESSELNLEKMEFHKRPFWFWINVIYFSVLLCVLKNTSTSGVSILGVDLSVSTIGAISLCILLAIDWWFSDTASKYFSKSSMSYNKKNHEDA